ncbi:peptidoglycan-binding protein [Bacillus sp. H-16]|uniref:L,D-transpeptidase family protein n=1 Tax=Alteribacter salitolerans TaxID=2912333 RepID=UPI001964CEAD|nr:peptidoglycan-binding protein [Alteribacter salitolerans]MBM7097915.1 peptidoglycan-binding protein [Alteribacter salitolerans]
MRKLLLCYILVGLVFLAWQVPSASASSSADQLIIINKSNNQLAFYENNKHVKTFSVATGRSASMTPEGTFKVVNKITNRPYYTGNIPGGDPRNPLGNRWIGLNANGTWGTTYAIHGNNNPSSIGTYASAGCIRMHNEEVKWLYDKVKVNTPVVIVSSSSSFNTIAKANGYNLDGKNVSVPVNSSTPTLQRGSRGAAVTDLQRQLTQKGYDTKGVDGIFGPLTESAVKKFQKDNKITSNGVVGSQTWNALKNAKATAPSNSTAPKKTTSTTAPATSQATVRQGSRGSAVTNLQTKLRQQGYSISVDGVFGPQTRSAVISFQRKKGLTQDGIVGPKTWGVLN